MDQFSDFAPVTRAKPVFRHGIPLEIAVTGADASSDAPLFGGEVLMAPRQVAVLLGITTTQLDRMIEAGVGPPYFRFGKRLRRFLPSIVRAWAASRVEITTIAERPP
jgi:predicted DNA-binding transcriptional regulator AlpA